jgi:hypothetical protein
MRSLTDRLFHSANASVHFALSCLEPVDGHSDRLRATSTFVDPAGAPMHWHDFGDLEGPGWAANAVGGALLLARWGLYLDAASIVDRAVALAAHVLEDGFVRSDGFIWPYRDLAASEFCLNYAHTNAWLCPGSLAKVGVQMLDLAAVLMEREPAAHATADRLLQAAQGLGRWLADHVTLLDNGWVPRRITPSGTPYPRTPEGGRDPIFDHSADGLFLLDLWARLDDRSRTLALGEAFVGAGGYWGSINHDTYDDHENVAYAVAFRVLRRAADRFSRPAWRDFAYDVALPAMGAFRMDRDEHGVATEGLFWMERSWDTAYLWENAEVAQAHLEAWLERGDADARAAALATLATMARHHTGERGFLTEGIDWNNHVSRRHHVFGDTYGAIRYTEPLLNNLHLVGPTLTYLEAAASRLGAGDGLKLDDASPAASMRALAELSPVSDEVEALEQREMRTWLRLYYPAVATDDAVARVLDFVRAAGIDGVWLFEAGYDTDPALLTPDVLAERFARLRTLAPRFRAAGAAVHINVMITMGHVDNGGGRSEDFAFQFLVDAEGHVSQSTACPLDPVFLDYAGEIYRRASACAEGSAAAIWVDDDVRFLIHDLPAITCFCPLHLAVMAARTGRAWTREALVEALVADRDLRRTWLDLQDAAMHGLVSRVERAIHDAAPDAAVGLMSVGTTIHNAEGRGTDKLLRALSGDVGRPMLRPGSGFWHDGDPGGVLVKTEDVARQLAYLGRDVLTVAEIENHPYAPYQKSRRLMALEMALNLLAGVHDLSLNIFSGTVPFREGETDVAGFLRAQRPYLQALARARAGKRRAGVGVEAREDVARTMRISALTGLIEDRPWEIVLARMGLPVGGPWDAPHLWSGAVAYTDRYAVGSSLQDGALLTPGAVRALLAQGWGGRLGIRAVRPAPPDVNEVVTHDPLNGDHRGMILPGRHYARFFHPHTYDLAPDAAGRALSTWRDLRGRDQGPGTVALTTPSGDRVGLLPLALGVLGNGMLHPLLQPARRDAWAALLAWVKGEPLPARVVGGMHVYPQVFLSRGGDEVLIALANLGFDDVVARLDAPILEGAAVVERLTSQGSWVDHADPGRVPVAAWSITALRARLCPPTTHPPPTRPS